MLKSQMSPEQQSDFYQWITNEWYRCDTHRATIENHAVNYLMTGNGGAAAAVIAFSGSAGYATNCVYLTLGLFLLGLFFTGCGIATGLHRLSKTTRDFGEDHRAFNADNMCSSELEQKHRARFQRNGLGNFLGWVAWICFICGIVASAYTFTEFMAAKRSRVAPEVLPATQTQSKDADQMPQLDLKSTPMKQKPKEKAN